jgi:hypothetical protein
MHASLLSFVAEDVAIEVVEYTPNFVVHSIAFGLGDPEANGHCWNFSRSSNDDWGVCTVREIQRATLYEGIASFNLQRSGLECVFDENGAAEIGFSELRITFEIDDQAWQKLVAAAQTIFRDRAYFNQAGEDQQNKTTRIDG